MKTLSFEKMSEVNAAADVCRWSGRVTGAATIVLVAGVVTGGGALLVAAGLGLYFGATTGLACAMGG